MTNLVSILKSRDITSPTKIHRFKAMVFPVVMYGCESWTVKQAELPRIDAFELWCWRRLLRAPWTARRSNQSILKVVVGFGVREGQGFVSNTQQLNLACITHAQVGVQGFAVDYGFRGEVARLQFQR